MAPDLSKRDKQIEEEQDGSLVRLTTHAGPLPHPAILAEYERVVPGGAERIFRQFEAQAAHRQQMEATVIRSNSFVQVFGSVSAFLLGLIGVGGGLFLVSQGRSIEGFAAFLAALASLVGVYVYGKKSQSAEMRRK